jgi:hypothetical protein
MKKLPPKFSLVVFGSRVPVSLVKNLALHAGALGQYQYLNKSIQLEAEQNNEEMCKSLLHEAGHSLFDRIGLTQAVSKELEEIIVESYSKLIYENFKIELK